MAILTSEVLVSGGHRVPVPINAACPVEFSNDNFQGRVVFLHRDISDSHALYFSRKRRFWELRWQGRFVRPPTSPIFIGAELREPFPDHGLLLRTTVQCVLGLVRGFAAARGARIVCNYDEISDRHHILFPLTAADVKVASASEREAPDIGAPVDLVSDADFAEDWTDNTCVYTFAFYTMYTDLGNWCIQNFPGISGQSLVSFAGSQPIFAVMREADKTNYFLEICFHNDLRSPAFQSAISDPDDHMALLDLAAPPNQPPSRRRLSNKFCRCFALCWKGVKLAVNISRSLCCGN